MRGLFGKGSVGPVVIVDVLGIRRGWGLGFAMFVSRCAAAEFDGSIPVTAGDGPARRQDMEREAPLRGSISVRRGLNERSDFGSGAREHALTLACARSPHLNGLFVAPGNPGCQALARTIALNLTEHDGIAKFCEEEAIDLVVVGPEAPLVAGIVDDLAEKGVLCFGPTRAAAQLEGSKGFAKDFCREFFIPTGEYRRFRNPSDAKAHVRIRSLPIVVKADGLAAAKGVVVATTLEEAEGAVDRLSTAIGSRDFGVSDRGISLRRRGVVLRALRWFHRRAVFLRRTPTSASATETQGRTPGEWALIRRRPS